MLDEELLRFLKSLSALIEREKDLLDQLQILIREFSSEI